MEIKISVEELRQKHIFVATPMYGGMCSGMYTRSAIDTTTLAARYGIDLKFFYLFNESLITRARNYLVDEFLRAEQYTHLMFVDSDISWDPNDLISLAALCDKDKHPVIGGPYPKKTIAWEKVRNAVDAGLGDNSPLDLEKYTGDFVFNPTGGNSRISLIEPVDVLETGTGFMMIHRSVFEKFKETYPKYSYKPDHNRTEHFKGDRYIHAYFDTIIDNDVWMGEGASNNSDRYLSEDYMFCQLVRKMGLSVWLCPWMVIQHVGHFVFNGNMKDLGQLQYASHGMDLETRPFKEKREEELKKKKSRRIK
tara:strand:+ start:4180 stop:5103 length:924 start_codon:yes stop_codon:yes gene_type:complete